MLKLPFNQLNNNGEENENERKWLNKKLISSHV